MESDSPVRSAVPTLAVQAWPFTEALLAGLEEALASLKSIGFDEIEIAGNRGSEPKDFADAAERAGLTILGSHEPCLRLESLDDDIHHLLARLDIFGCRYATLSSCTPGHMRRQDRDGYLRYADACCRTADHLASAGRRLTFHPYTRDLVALSSASRECGLDLLLRQCPQLEVEMDLFFLHRAALREGTDAQTLYRRYSDRITLCHVRNVGADARETQLAAGGALRLEEWLLRSSHRVHRFILEFDPLTLNGATAVDFARAGRSAWQSLTGHA